MFGANRRQSWPTLSLQTSCSDRIMRSRSSSCGTTEPHSCLHGIGPQPAVHAREHLQRHCHHVRFSTRSDSPPQLCCAKLGTSTHRQLRITGLLKAHARLLEPSKLLLFRFSILHKLASKPQQMHIGNRTSPCIEKSIPRTRHSPQLTNPGLSPTSPIADLHTESRVLPIKYRADVDGCADSRVSPLAALQSDNQRKNAAPGCAITKYHACMRHAGGHESYNAAGNVAGLRPI